MHSMRSDDKSRQGVICMKRSYGLIWAVLALGLYVVGGLLIMAGLILIGILGAEDLWGWGEARGIGYMAFGIGIFLSIFGVMIMRIMRNRGVT